MSQGAVYYVHNIVHTYLLSFLVSLSDKHGVQQLPHGYILLTIFMLDLHGTTEPVMNILTGQVVNTLTLQIMNNHLYDRS